MSVQSPIRTVTDNLVYYYDTNNAKSYTGEPTTNIWSVQAGTNLNAFNSWDMPNGGTASITSAVSTAYGSWNGNRIWLVTVGSGTLVSYGSWRLCVDQPTAGSAYPSTRRLAAKIRMLTGSITNIGLHTGGGTGAYSAGDFSDIPEGSVPADCALKDGWKQMLSDASWSSTTVTHCVGIGLNNSGPYSFLVTEPMYYPSNHLIPYTPSSRSNVQGLLDLTNNYNTDLTNAGYTSTGNLILSSTNSNYISAGNGFANFTSGITCEFWAKFSSSAYTWERLMDFGTGQAANNIICCRYASSDSLWFEFYNGAGSSTMGFQATNAITNGSYAHYAFTANGTTAVIYKNGLPHTSTSTSALPTNTTRTNCWIGRSNWGADSYFTGYIPVTKIYNRALTQSEILQNFNSTRSRFGL